MKKMIFLFTLSLLLVGMAWGQGTETFENHSISGTSYVDGSFVGVNNITWNYVQVTGEQTYPIENKGILLRCSGANSKIYSSAIPGGIGNFSIKMRKAFTGAGDRQVALYINGTHVADSQTFGAASGADATIHTFSVNNINIAGDVVIEVRHITGGSTNRQLVLDDLTWTGFLSGGNLPPSISNISISPSSDITSSTPVTVSATITDSDGTVDAADVLWGTTSGNRTNSVGMTAAGDTWSAVIPAQADGTTVYYSVYAMDNDADDAESTEQSYLVRDPITTTLPYTENFDADLGDLYAYSAQGDTKEWLWSSGGYAYMNGYGSGETEEDWLILPGINLSTYPNAVMTFDTWHNYGTIDDTHYLRLMYSSDYYGIGDPSTATWNEVPFAYSASTSTWASSGPIDLSGISVSRSNVYLAFKYYYPDNYKSWQVDNISITEVVDPTLAVDPASLTGFEYDHENGPSGAQSFTVGGLNLTANVIVSALTNYEISETIDSAYTNTLTFTPVDGAVSFTVYARLKAGLAIGTYNEDVTVTSTGVTAQTVSLSGEVVTPPPPGYLVDFEGDGETKGSYAIGTVNLSGIDWDMTEALIGNSEYEFFNGSRSARMRGYGTSSMTMLADKTDGLGTLSFQYRRYGTDTQVDWKVEYSTNGGIDWTQVGSDFTAPATDDVQTFTEVLNVAGNVRIRIKRATESGTANRRMNIDDIFLSDYEETADIPENTPTIVEGVTITIVGGDANIGSGDIPAWNNPSFTLSHQFTLDLIGAGPWSITIQTDAPWGAYYANGSWTAVQGDGTSITFNISASKDLGGVHIVLGDSNLTLPVELSSFTAVFNAFNNVVLTWVTQSETGVLGFYVYRNTDPDLANALQVSPLIDATNTASQKIYVYKDKGLNQIDTYYYWLMAADMDGSENFHGPIHVRYEGIQPDVPEIQAVTALKQIYPNPFNPNTTISYSLAAAHKVRFAIYNGRGQIVKEMDLGSKNPGDYTITWDGNDQNGQAVGTGVYFIRMYAGGDSFSRKAVLLK